MDLRWDDSALHYKPTAWRTKPSGLWHLALGDFEVKNGPKKCTKKINFIRTNKIQNDDVIPRDKYFGGKRRKLHFLIIFLAYLLISLLKSQM